MSARSGSLLAGLRQLVYPSAFRIPPPAWPPDLLAGLDQIAKIRITAATGDADKDLLRLFASVGTGLWRLRGRMQKAGSDRPAPGMERAFTHLQSVWDVLAKAGLVIRDHTGEAVPETGSYALDVLSREPQPGFTRSKVIETIKPSIAFRGQLIQAGAVVVGTPPVSTGTPPGDATS
jgi:hypothetical protein